MVSAAGGALLSINIWAQTQPDVEKMSVQARMAKARAAKADKKLSQAAEPTASPSGTLAPATTKQSYSMKASSTANQASVVKPLKGPNGEVVHTGEEGGKYYINKNGNKTYLSSNQ